MIPVRLKKGKEEAIRNGMPWIYASDIVDSAEWRMAPPGSLAQIETARGEFIGIGYVNAASQIAGRVLTLKNEKIDAAFFTARIKAALARREKIIGAPYYRLAHSEADGLPGLLLDRFGDIIVAQVGTAGMEQLQPLWVAALEEVVSPKIIVLRNDASARKLEGLKQEIITLPLEGGGKGGGLGSANSNLSSMQQPDPHLHLPPSGGKKDWLIEVHQNNMVYFADLVKGQKTGWFYDQRDNHALVANMSKGKTVLDVYAHSGGFGLLAAKHGAAEVTMVDSSALALGLAKKVQAKNTLEHCEYIQGDAFEIMENLARAGRNYDIVISDPPPFIKTKKDIASGLKGYAKMAKLAAALAAPGGHLFAASCSHHASRGAFNNAVMEGIGKAGRTGALIKQTGASADHPIHPKLPQSEYLKGLLIRLD